MFHSLAKGYSALQKAGQPQSELEIIDKLCDRLLNGTQLEDRRAALLGLKGLSRDWKAVSKPVRVAHPPPAHADGSALSLRSCL